MRLTTTFVSLALAALSVALPPVSPGKRVMALRAPDLFNMHGLVDESNIPLPGGCSLVGCVDSLFTSIGSMGLLSKRGGQTLDCSGSILDSRDTGVPDFGCLEEMEDIPADCNPCLRKKA